MFSQVVRFLIVGLMTWPLVGCQTGKQYSIGGGPTISVNQPMVEEAEPEIGTVVRQARSDDGIDVLKISHDQALDIAHAVAKIQFPGATIKRTSNGIVIDNRNFWMGNALASIKPKLVNNLGADGGHGFTFETQAFGITASNPSMLPSYVTSEFFANLAQYRAENKIEDVHFASYKFTDDRGVTEVMPATVPVTYTGFTGFLDKRRNLARFEGIWSDHGGRNVLGIIADRSNPLFNYKAFVISSKEPNWKPGDVKIKFNRLRPRRPTVSQFWASDKRESGVTWRADEEYIVSLNSVDEPRRRGQIALVKTYPTGRKGATTGVGTGWAVTGDGIFATNYHVIEDADTIWVGFRGRNEQKARVIAVDKRVDLALIKIENPNRSYRPLPLSTGPASNGSAVTVIGYPLAFELGDDPRVTNGLISAQKGIGGDITRYQISAAVQRGNSGGPVLNNRAEVVGVVVQRFFAEAENVNFAVKVPYLKLLLESAGIEYARGRSDGTRSPKELFEIFGDSVLPVWSKE